MEYRTYPCEVKFQYLVLRQSTVLAGFNTEDSAVEYAYSVGATVWKAAQNPRNAGRYPIYSDREKDEILDQISKGASIRSIARQFRCSVGYVHKLKSERSMGHGNI